MAVLRRVAKRNVLGILVLCIFLSVTAVHADGDYKNDNARRSPGGHRQGAERFGKVNIDNEPFGGSRLRNDKMKLGLGLPAERKQQYEVGNSLPDVGRKNQDAVRIQHKNNPGVAASPNREPGQTNYQKPGRLFQGQGGNAGGDGAPDGGVGRAGRRRSNAIKIADSAACAADVKALCSASSLTNNFAVLDCLQYDIESEKEVSEQCQNFLWQYKKNLTTDVRFDSAASEVCKDAIKEFSDCSELHHGTGHLVSCLIEHKANVTSSNCKQFLTKMASIVFSDYRLVYRFTDECREDIQKYNCGRLHKETDVSPHSQGKTLECMTSHVREVAQECKHQILRIAELQADDYHMDRPLFYACRDDRERFCQRTKAGGGKIYKCLFRHKFERDMSSACREKLTGRQSLMRENFKANKALTEACRQDIRTYKCMKGDVPRMRQAKLSFVLLCLEGVQREGQTVTPECIAELKDIRRSLMEDYKISPNIVVKCENEIRDHCNQGLHREGKTLHCLMDLARPRRREKPNVDSLISKECISELRHLLVEVNPAEDYSMDPALQEACQTVVDTACKNVKRGDARVIACLMEKIGSDKMNDDCEERLMEIQFFVARDFKLDPRLYRLCNKDAQKFCSAKANWYNPEARNPESNSMIFSCLYRHVKFFSKDAEKQLTRGCMFEVKRLMHQRAVSVELEPRIEEPCLSDLGQYCSEDVQKGEEMSCLQKYMNENKLTDACRVAVGNYTQDIDKDPTMDKILMRSCTPMIKEFCSDIMDKDNAEATDIMDCLIKNKNKNRMDRKCSAGIEHHQLVTMQDWHFTYKFKEACKQDVLNHCRGVRRKFDVIKCLSETVRNDTLLERDHRLSRPCRKQLRFELFQRSENILLDPILESACDLDRKQYCSNISPGRAQVVECLKKHDKDLGTNCRKVLFRRERQEANDNAVDYTLMATCKAMIKLFCADVEPAMILGCLRSKKNELDFDQKCRMVIRQRQIIRSKDIRLNPQLQSSCKLDIPKFCKAELAHAEEGHKLEGRVIKCLKLKFIAHRLSRDCEDHMRTIMKESALDYKQDPVLAAACQQEIQTMCLHSLTAADNDEDGRGGVEECLKAKLTAGLVTKKECKMEIIRVLAESRADVHVDPLLHRACALDIKHYCYGVSPGEGRHMSCLLAALEDKTVRLKVDCRKMLRDRVNMWEYAAKVAPPDTFEDLLVQIQSSKSKNYFFIVILAVLGIIFFGGLFCGRVTKRVRAELKNK